MGAFSLSCEFITLRLGVLVAAQGRPLQIKSNQIKMIPLKKFDRVRLKVNSWASKKGTKGTVLKDEGAYGVDFLKDSPHGDDPNFYHPISACRFQVAKLRDQTPNPHHVNLIKND